MGSRITSTTEFSSATSGRRNSTTGTASRRVLSPQTLKLGAAGILLLAVGAVSFWIGRVFPVIASGVSEKSTATVGAAAIEPGASNTAVVSGNAAQELEQIAKLEPILAFGDEMGPDSQADDGNRINMPSFQAADIGEPDGFSMTGNPDSDFVAVFKAQFALRVEERREGRYRAVALLGGKPAVNSTEPESRFRVMAIAPPLNAQNNNAGWVFRHLGLQSSLITDSGTIIRHPDVQELEMITQGIVSGQTGPAAVLKSLQTMRYPDARKALFINVAGDPSLQDGPREMCLRLLACPIVPGLFFDADVGPGGFMTNSERGNAVKAFADANLPPRMADLIVDAMLTQTKVQSILHRKLNERVFGADTADEFTDESGDTLPELTNEALNSVWENASTDAIIRLMVAMNGKNRSAQLRRLFRDRQLTEAQIAGIVTPQSSAEESGALLGKVSISIILDIIFRTKDTFGPSSQFKELAENPSLTTEDANELAKACIRFKQDSDASTALDVLEGKADIDHYVLALAQCGSSSELEDQIRKLRDPDEKSRVLNRAADEMKNGRPRTDTLLLLAPYGTVSNILAAMEKFPDGIDMTPVLKKLSVRSDLTEADRTAIRKFVQPQ